MVQAFNVLFEFDPEAFDQFVRSFVAEKKAGYCCVIDANVLTVAQEDLEYRRIVNGASINTCDGSSIAAMAGKIHGRDYKTYNGPEIFNKYIAQPYRHVIIGNTEENFAALVAKLRTEGVDNEVFHLPVPFVPVEEFDYEAIAGQLNALQPDMVWVSLGAPKQERFISRLYPHVKQGLLFGIGAAISFYLGDVTLSTRQVGGVRLIWLERIFKEPKKQVRRCWRYLKIMPRLYREEKRRIAQAAQ